MVSKLIEFPPVHMLRGCDVLHSAIVYLRGQYHDDMTRDQALIHFRARALLTNLQNQILDELEFGSDYISKPLVKERQ